MMYIIGGKWEGAAILFVDDEGLYAGGSKLPKVVKILSEYPFPKLELCIYQFNSLNEIKPLIADEYINEIFNVKKEIVGRVVVLNFVPTIVYKLK